MNKPDDFYAPPAAALDHGLQDDGDIRTYLRAFVGKNADHYLEKFEPGLRGGGSIGGFSIGAFFLGTLFFLYRKMYLVGFGLFGLQIAIGVVSGIIETPEVVDRALSLGINVVIAMKANSLYFKHASDKISEAQREGYEGTRLLDVLKERGGTNLWLPLLFAFLFAGLIFLAVMLLVSTQGL